jgi:hypothetical protein
MNHSVWDPSVGHDTASEQRPPGPGRVDPDGTIERTLEVPSEGPCRPEVGGAGGEPEGRSLPIRKVSWD